MLRMSFFYNESTNKTRDDWINILRNDSLLIYALFFVTPHTITLFLFICWFLFCLIQFDFFGPFVLRLKDSFIWFLFIILYQSKMKHNDIRTSFWLNLSSSCFDNSLFFSITSLWFDLVYALIKITLHSHTFPFIAYFFVCSFAYNKNCVRSFIYNSDYAL